MGLPHLLTIIFLTLSFFISTKCSHDDDLPSDLGVRVDNFTQRLSHIENQGKYHNVTFQQQYVVNNDNWSRKLNEPIFVFLGGDSPISTYAGHIGILNKVASRLNGLIVYIEHRFHGASVPFGSTKIALGSPSVRSYLNVEEALADYACLIISLKANLSAPHSPIIVVGTFYGGMLAAWFRTKYPNIAIGALASSAPMLFSQDPSPGNDFCSIVTRDFEQVNIKCANIIRQSYSMIDEIASGPQGVAILSRIFNVCRGRYLRSAHELKQILANVYSYAAQSKYYSPNDNQVKLICDIVIEASTNNNTLKGLDRVLSFINGGVCLDIDSGYENIIQSFAIVSQLTWNWQSCSEIPILKSCNGNNSIIPRDVFRNQSRHYKGCLKKYNIMPSPNWLWMSRQDTKKLGSNIIFSNALTDPYSSFGILDDVSDTVVAINTAQGPHCQDMINEQETESSKELIEMEIIIFKKWIETSGANLLFPMFMYF